MCRAVVLLCSHWARGRYDCFCARAASTSRALPPCLGTQVQPFWLRYGLELFQLGQPQEALGIVRRVAAKFDIEPECQLALYTITTAVNGERGAAEALRLWNVAPSTVKERTVAIDFADRGWPPAAANAARAFLMGVTSGA